MYEKIEPNKLWDERSQHYDKLFWTKDEKYLDEIIRVSDFKSDDLVLDVGTGTGIIAKKINPLVKHVIGIDISDSMLGKGEWNGVSTVKWDIRDALFTNNIFDKVIARMVFHHITNNLDIAIIRCFDLLKNGGKIVIAEGVPPSSDHRVVEWYTNMFKLKENRRTISRNDMTCRLKKTGFRNIRVYEYIMRNFSIKNWLINSGIDQEIQDKIMEIHFSANKEIKIAYNMRYTNNDCLIDTRNVIITGIK